MNDLRIFKDKEFGEIRTVTIDDEPWFVGKDVAKALGYGEGKSLNNAVANHVNEEDKGVTEMVTPGGKQNMTIINESGLYALIFGSKLESAQRFKHWVTSEVLPSIRKHGMYAKEELLNNPDLLISVAQELKKEREKNKALEADNARMKPKEIFADAVSASDSAMLVRDVAKLIRQNGVPLGEKRFYTWLRENGYVCQNSTAPTQKAMELGLFEIIVRTIERGDKLPIETKTTKITGKGQQYFINKFLNKKAGRV